MGAAQLFHAVTEIALPHPFLCVKRSPIWDDFRGGAKAIRYSVNIASLKGIEKRAAKNVQLVLQHSCKTICTFFVARF